MTFEPCDHHIQAEKLARITPEQWKAQGMKPVSPQALEHAMEWLNGLVLVPCGSGNVHVEVHDEWWDVELEFNGNGLVAMLARCADRAVTLERTNWQP